MNSIPIKRIFGLDFLRTIAISLVLISHISLLVCPSSDAVIIKIIRVFGAVGVDLFFVLSGFLIGGILLKQIDLNKTSFRDLLIFWKRRWFRTLPNYYLVLIVNLIIFFILNNSFPNKANLYFLFLQNFSFPHPDFFTEAWSLSIEEYAYLLLPVIMFLCFNLFKTVTKRKLFFIVTILVILGLVVFKIFFYLNIEISSYFEWSRSFRKVVIYRVDSIYIGFLLVYFVKYYSNLVFNNKNKLLVAGLLIFTLLHVYIYIQNILPQTHLRFYVFIYLQVVILSLGLVFPFFIKLNYSGFLSKPVRFVSLHSYSIYLVNYSIVLVCMKEVFNVTNYSILNRTVLGVMFLIITFLLSFVIYRYFELPILKYRDKKYKRTSIQL